MSRYKTKNSSDLIDLSDLPPDVELEGTATTPTGTWTIRYAGKPIPVSAVSSDYPRFSAMCKTSCKRFGSRFSCPPHAPSFPDLSRGYNALWACYMRMDVTLLPGKSLLQKIGVGNRILRSRLEKSLRILERQRPGSLMLGCGPCRLCRKCSAPAGEPCRKGSLLRYSPQSTGIDIGALLKEQFNIDLEWAWNSEYRFTVVVGGLLYNDPQLA